MNPNGSITQAKPKKGRKSGYDNKIKGGPPRDQNTANYLPDIAAEGSSHTTLGIEKGRKVGLYVQGATFDANGEFKGRTDVTDHGRPQNHHNPHFHPAHAPNGCETRSFPIDFL